MPFVVRKMPKPVFPKGQVRILPDEAWGQLDQVVWEPPAEECLFPRCVAAGQCLGHGPRPSPADRFVWKPEDIEVQRGQ